MRSVPRLRGKPLENSSPSYSARSGLGFHARLIEMNFPTGEGTYDHRLENADHPVRSGVLKLEIGRLVLRWVTTREYLLLYVFVFVLSMDWTFRIGRWWRVGGGMRAVVRV